MGEKLSSISGLAGKLYGKFEGAYTALGFVYLSIYSIQVLAEPAPAVYEGLEIAGHAIYWIFAIDVLLRVVHLGKDILTAAGFIGFMKQNWLALLALLLPAFRALRVLRVILVIRGLQPFLRSRSSKVGATVGVTFPLTLYTAALAVFEAERNVEGANITSFGDALWWSITSVTTVGYGDRYPVTADGRFIATFLMIIGIVLFSALTALLAAWVMGDKKSKEDLA